MELALRQQLVELRQAAVHVADDDYAASAELARRQGGVDDGRERVAWQNDSDGMSTQWSARMRPSAVFQLGRAPLDFARHHNDAHAKTPTLMYARSMRKVKFYEPEMLPLLHSWPNRRLAHGHAPRGVRDGWVGESSVGMATAAAATATPRCAGSMATSFRAPWSFPVCGCTAMPVTREESPAVTSCALRTGCSRKPTPLHRIHIFVVTDVGAKLHPHPAPRTKGSGGSCCCPPKHCCRKG